MNNQPRPNKCRICECPEYDDNNDKGTGRVTTRLFYCGEDYDFRKHKWSNGCKDTWKTIRKLRATIKRLEAPMT